MTRPLRYYARHDDDCAVWQCKRCGHGVHTHASGTLKLDHVFVVASCDCGFAEALLAESPPRQMRGMEVIRLGNVNPCSPRQGRPMSGSALQTKSGRDTRTRKTLRRNSGLTTWRAGWTLSRAY